MTFVFWIEEPCDTNRTVMLHGILISVMAARMGGEFGGEWLHVFV